MKELHLCTSPVLAIYSQEKEVYIYTDASGDGVRTLLKQPEKKMVLNKS